MRLIHCHGLGASERRFLRAFFLGAVILAAGFCSQTAPEEPPPEPKGLFHTVGNPGDVSPACAFGMALVGGGRRCNEAYRWLIERSGGGDFVFLTASAYNDEEDEEFLADMRQLGTVDSITTLTVDSRGKADLLEVEEALRKAELLYIDGGDQTEYFNLWNGTRLQRAVQALLRAKKIPVGGTSAGMAVLSELAYIPLRAGVTSAQALADPFHANMDSIKKDFLSVERLANAICDTHWSERDRCGRTIAFLARIVSDGLAPFSQARAIACDEGTAVCIDGNDQAVVFGGAETADYAYFISCRSEPERCLPGRSLHWPAAVSIWKLRGTEAGSNSFDLGAWRGHGGTLHEVNVLNGVLWPDIQTPD
jgi:cyanophycinase-like exopeptidase